MFHNIELKLTKYQSPLPRRQQNVKETKSAKNGQKRGPQMVRTSPIDAPLEAEGWGGRGDDRLVAKRPEHHNMPNRPTHAHSTSLHFFVCACVGLCVYLSVLCVCVSVCLCACVSVSV